ncbi:MAG: trigger factor [Candidatus Marinimicrobia bacterium]|nr:trigger factor [Candidatus Neomarinimicrobiota bacterium]OUW49866.1 MAG: trigger factor [bacterium TMED190]|tara:strand:- start:5609 stop:6901 length:1293 start_codon:yes stop_codon:yes gene_type:complete
MISKIKSINSFTKKITVSVAWSDLEEPFTNHIKLFSKKINMPGFRKGKVPKKIILQNYKSEVEADFAQSAIDQYYALSLKEQKIVPISRANIDKLDFSEKKSLEFEATVEVQPDFKLPNFSKKMKLKKNNYIADDIDVDKYIEEIQLQFSELKTIEDGSKNEDLILVDMQELDSSGVPLIGKKIENRYIKIGDGLFGGDNLKKLTGLKKDDNVKIEIPNAENIITKFSLTVKMVQKQILPDLNNAFLKKVDPTIDNIDEFRKKVMDKIQSQLNGEAEEQLSEKIIDFFIDKTKLDAPDSMIENTLINSINEARKRDPNNFDEEKYKIDVKSSIIRSIKWYLIRNKLIDKENLKIDDKDIDKHVELLVENSKSNENEIKRFYKKPSNMLKLKDDLLDRNLFKFLKEQAIVKLIDIKTEDLRKQNESLNKGD